MAELPRELQRTRRVLVKHRSRPRQQCLRLDRLNASVSSDQIMHMLSFSVFVAYICFVVHLSSYNHSVLLLVCWQ